VRSGVEKALYESAGEAQFENDRLRTALKDLRKVHANQDRDYQREREQTGKEQAKAFAGLHAR